MEKWNPSLRTGFRLTWVQVWGIPLQAWDSKHFRHILVAMGERIITIKEKGVRENP